MKNIEFHFMKKAYLFGISFFPEIKGYFGDRAELRIGFGFFAFVILFGKKYAR